MSNSTASNSPAASGSARDTFPPVPRPIRSSDYVPQTSGATLAAVVALCGVFLLTSLNRLNHTDFWGHLCYGRWISQSGQLPSSDPFAARTEPAQPAGRFVNVPWLAQWSAYELYRLGGPQSLVFAHAAMVMAGCGWLMLAIAARGVRPGGAVAGGLVMYLLALPTMGTVRPQLWGVVAFPLVLLGISLLPRRSHPMFWLPVMFTLWANLHGSFILGLGVLAIWVLVSAWHVGQSTEDVGRWRPFWLIALCVIASCLNPAGPQLLVQVASFGGNPALEKIVEWGPLVIKSLGGVLFFGSLLVTCFVIRRSSRQFQAGEVVLLIIFGLFSLISLRMLVWWSILWPWVLVPHLLSCWPRRWETQDEPEYPDASRGTMRTLYALGCILVVLCWSPSSRAFITGQTRRMGELTSSDTPLYVADQIRWRKLTGNVFCPLDWGDFLIWRSDGAIKPLVYSHVHLVQPEVWDDYLRIYRGDRNWTQLADQHGLDYLVLSRTRNDTLRRDVEQHPRASILYQDEQSLLVQLLTAAPGQTNQASGSL